MDKEYISKKELLKITGISYGQLYRWKRQGLIPEEWFIKKSVSTGQETYFPKKKILERIEAIERLKNRYSFDELAKLFAPDVSAMSYSIEKIRLINIIDEKILDVYVKKYATHKFLFTEVCLLYVATRALIELDLTDETLDVLVKSINVWITQVDINKHNLNIIDLNGSKHFIISSDKAVLTDTEIDLLKSYSFEELSGEIIKKLQKIAFED